MRINIRLIRASQFLRQFNLEVRHKLKKKHIISDALSRLTSANQDREVEVPQYFELDAFYTCFLIGIFDDFRSRFINDYAKDP